MILVMELYEINGIVLKLFVIFHHFPQTYTSFRNFVSSKMRPNSIARCGSNWTVARFELVNSMFIIWSNLLSPLFICCFWSWVPLGSTSTTYWSTWWCIFCEVAAVFRLFAARDLSVVFLLWGGLTIALFCVWRGVWNSDDWGEL